MLIYNCYILWQCYVTVFPAINVLTVSCGSMLLVSYFPAVVAIIGLEHELIFHSILTCLDTLALLLSFDEILSICVNFSWTMACIDMSLFRRKNSSWLSTGFQIFFQGMAGNCCVILVPIWCTWTLLMVFQVSLSPDFPVCGEKIAIKGLSYCII